MNFLLDTCVISELVKKTPNQAVVDWIQQQNHANCFISSITLGEIQKGISKLAVSAQKDDLQAWLNNDVRARFIGQTIAIEANEALQWGEVQAAAEAQGKPMPMIDSLIAASAIFQDMTLVTRNTKDMEASGVKLFNPWVL
ncbi:MAG: type II toxin-antitoxin system VapC family toxin [Methylophilaceae bacterium]